MLKRVEKLIEGIEKAKKALEDFRTNHKHKAIIVLSVYGMPGPYTCWEQCAECGALVKEVEETDPRYLSLANNTFKFGSGIFEVQPLGFLPA